MSSFFTPYQHDASLRSALLLPAALLISSVVALLGTPIKHSLLTSAVAWLAICALVTFKAGSKNLLAATPAQRLAWAAGTLLTLAQIEERAVEGSGFWWAKALLPAAVYGIARTGSITDNAISRSPESPTIQNKPTAPASHSSTIALFILTLSGIVATCRLSSSNAIISLGLSYAILYGSALLLIERAREQAQYSSRNTGSVIYSANGFLAQPEKSVTENEDASLAVIRDVSLAVALGTSAAALSLEGFSFGGVEYYGLIDQAFGSQWVFWQAILSTFYWLGMVTIHSVMDGFLLLMILRNDAFTTSFVPLYAALSAQLIADFSLTRLWFGILCTSAIFLFLDDKGNLAAGSRTRIRVSRLLTAVALVSFGALLVLHFQRIFSSQRLRALTTSVPDRNMVAAPADASAPIQFTNTRVHPIDQLGRDAEASWTRTLQAQSKTLEAAVAEYKRRYGIPPPPNFDRWYEFAKEKGVQLIDEYDTIYHSLLPFWALPPATIRARVREAIGFAPNNLMGLLIRDGKANHVEGGQDWLQQAVVGMTKSFVQWLPDMDLAFNTHDEPRVVVPHDELSRLVRIARDEGLPAAAQNSAPKNTFSQRPRDVNAMHRVDEFKTTRFNHFAHQATWVPSRLSCSPESPARQLDDTVAADNLTAYALSTLGFIYNHTAFTDVCNSPSLATSHGFFDRPNAFNVVHDLFPIFSQSKMSSFQDILYPSPWYWFGKVVYSETRDMAWNDKESVMWWRGSTTGGFSRDGGWRRQHRQQLVKKINALDNAKVMQDVYLNGPDASVPEWQVREVSRQQYKDVMDVHFSHVGQCDPGDCDAQREYFDIVPPADQQDAWKYRFLLDMDGNAFSGRFYAFLRSRSLAFKMAVFREWHEEWIRPWVHYIPISLRGEEVLETVRYAIGEEEGRRMAVAMSERSRDWAGKALRNGDFEAWLFRLLLEYGRVVDDDRANIGYTGS